MRRNNFRGGIKKPVSLGAVVSHKKLKHRPKSRSQAGSTNLRTSSSCSQLPRPNFICTNDPWTKQLEKERQVLKSARLSAGRPATSFSARASPRSDDLSEKSSTRESEVDDDEEEGLHDLAVHHSRHNSKCTLAVQLDRNNPENIASFKRMRKQLHHTVVNQFGSVRTMFSAFDTLNSGHVSYEAFQAAIQSFNLDISCEDQHLLYHWVDEDNSNSIEFTEFSSLFDPTPVISPFTISGNENAALKQHTFLELSPRSKLRVENFRTLLSNAIIERQDRDTIAYESNTKLLLHAFRQMDEKGTGCLTYEQLKGALGDEVLNLHIDEDELSYMIATADTDGDGNVSYKEFISYFAVDARDDYNDMIEEGRAKELKLLQKKMESRTIFLEPLVEKQATLSVLQVPPVAQEEEVLPPDHRRQRLLAAKHMKMYSKGEPKNTPIKYKDRELHLGRHDRFFRKRLHKTDWSRVGFGGNGIRTDSGLYLNPKERFLSTSQSQHSLRPFATLNGIVQEDNRVSKMKTSTKTFRIQTSLERNERYAKVRASLHHQNDQDSNLAKSSLRMQYLSTVHLNDPPATAVSSKARGTAFHRMHAGSLESQFNTSYQAHIPSIRSQ